MTPDAQPPIDETPDQGEPHPWEAQMDVYPKCAPEDDPKWAIRVVTVWAVISVGLLLFIIALVILGLFYD